MALSPTEYMLVMEVEPSDGRKYKHRVFVSMVRDQPITSQFILDKELSEAKRIGERPGNVLTVNVVKLQ